MNPKLSWTEKLKRYRRAKAEEYARIVMEPPPKINLYRILPFPGLILIMGGRRMGKTGLAHEIANQVHKRRGLPKGVPAVIHMPRNVPENIRRNIQRHLPNWMQIVNSRNEWPKNSVVIYDEAAQTAHARRTQSGDAVELDDLISVSGQRNQLIIFIAHHSRKLDLNVVTEVNRIIWKKPTYAHQLFERDEVSDFSMKAYDFFAGIKGELAQKKVALALDFDNFSFSRITNKLPPWWCDELSRLFQDVQRIKEVFG
jgi:hypothetical protein